MDAFPYSIGESQSRYSISYGTVHGIFQFNHFRCKVRNTCNGSTGQHEAIDILELKEMSQKKFKEWQKKKQQDIDILCTKVCS